MKNLFEERDNHIVIFVTWKGEKVECLISKESFDKVNSFPGTWTVKANNKGVPYVITTTTKQGKTALIPLHRVLTDCPEGLVPDHINSNPLDNRLENLEVVTPRENALRAIFSRPGIRGVRLTKSGKWKSEITFLGKTYNLGTHKTYIEAIQARRRAEIMHYGVARQDFSQVV